MLSVCAGASVYSSQIEADNSTYRKNKESRFIVSDGQGQLTVLGANDLTGLESDIIVNDSKRHMMSFDNHLQAL